MLLSILGEQDTKGHQECGLADIIYVDSCPPGSANAITVTISFGGGLVLRQFASAFHLFDSQDVVVLDDDEEEEGEAKVNTMEKSSKQVLILNMPIHFRHSATIKVSL